MRYSFLTNLTSWHPLEEIKICDKLGVKVTSVSSSDIENLSLSQEHIKSFYPYLSMDDSGAFTIQNKSITDMVLEVNDYIYKEKIKTTPQVLPNNKIEEFNFITSRWAKFEIDTNLISEGLKKKILESYTESHIVFEESLANFLEIINFMTPAFDLDWPDDIFYYEREIKYLDSVLIFDKTIRSFMLRISNSKIAKKTSYDDLYFEIISSHFINLGAKISNAISKNNIVKVLYIGSLLKAARKSDIRLQFVSLVSIIEILLTRNPDFNRFNVEGSISKQFKLKAGVIIYNADKSQSLDEIETNLKLIYTMRSNFAHGNFSKIKSFSGSVDDGEFPQARLYDLTSILMKYIRIILNEYWVNMKLINFLKKS